jgi:hypothetical protein
MSPPLRVALFTTARASIDLAMFNSAATSSLPTTAKARPSVFSPRYPQLLPNAGVSRVVSRETCHEHVERERWVVSP